MSRPEFDVKEEYLGDGTLDTYTFDFKIEKPEYLQCVIYNELDEEISRFRGSDETEFNTLTFDAIKGAGTIILLANLPVDHKLILLLANDTPIQKFEFDNKMSFNLKRIEMALDNIQGAVQRLAYRAKQSLRINDFDDENSFNGQLPPDMVKNAKKVIIINEDGDGLDVGPTLDQIDGQVQAAEDAMLEAQQARDDAQTAANEASDSAQEASDSAIAAEEFRDETEEFKDETEVIRDEAEAYANLFLFDNVVKIDDTQSPYSVGSGEDSTLFLADDTDGAVDFNLPDLAGLMTTWHVAMIKQSDSMTAISINPYPGQTINGLPNVSLAVKGIGIAFFKETATNWSVKYLPFTDSGSSLPAGGDTDSVLMKKSPANNDTEWNPIEFTGFSARFNTAWNSKGLMDTLMKILDITYLGPLIAGFTGSSNILREKGTVVNNITLSVNVTKRSNSIARILFTQGGTTIADLNPPAQTGSGVSTANYNTPFSDNITFSVAVTDAIEGGAGPTTVNANLTYSFVYPYYFGARAPGATAAQVAALTKDIISSSATLLRNFTNGNGEVYYFAYPASYGDLTSILDINSFEVLGSWTKRVENITGLNGVAVSYNIYEFNNAQVAGTTSFTFKR